MKKGLIAFFIISAAFIAVSFAVSSKSDPYNFKVKEMYAAPDKSSKLVFQIPIDVRLLDISKDRNWYKVYTKFSLGPIQITHAGWVNIPIGLELQKTTTETTI